MWRDIYRDDELKPDLLYLLYIYCLLINDNNNNLTIKIIIIIIIIAFLFLFFIFIISFHCGSVRYLSYYFGLYEYVYIALIELFYI